VVVDGGKTSGSGSNKSSLFKKNPRNFRLGGDIQPKRNLTRFVKWPKYIRIQRQKRILYERLKVPPTIAQFQNTIEKNEAAKLLKLLAKYSPETKQDKKARLQKVAEAKGEQKGPKPNLLKFGLNHVTTLVEEGKAKLVVIAHDVDPIELVVHLPALCRRKNVPYCFIRGKATLGKLVHQKTATTVALTTVGQEDMADLNTLGATFRANFNENAGLRKTWGGNTMGIKNQHKMAFRQKLIDIELAKKANM